MNGPRRSATAPTRKRALEPDTGQGSRNSTTNPGASVATGRYLANAGLANLGRDHRLRPAALWFKTSELDRVPQGAATNVQIDHRYTLARASDMDAAQWPLQRRIDFARHTPPRCRARSAAPLQHEIDMLARITRITLREPAKHAGTTPAQPVLASLTAREREIRTSLHAGRSNGAIAKELVISDRPSACMSATS